MNSFQMVDTAVLSQQTSHYCSFLPSWDSTVNYLLTYIMML